VWPEELLFYTSLSSPFCVVDLTNHRRQQAPHTDLKKIKNKERSLSLSLSLCSLPRKALFEVRERRFFSLSKNVEKKKAEKKSKTFARARLPTRAQEEREKKKGRPIFERIELFSSSRCVLCLFFAFARRRGRNARERERATVRHLTLLTL
jgi:hypothetical protein